MKSAKPAFLAILLALIALLCQPAGQGKATEEKARQERRDSLLAAVEAEIDSLNVLVVEIDSVVAVLDSAFAGMESEAWYREKKLKAQAIRAGLLQRIENRRQERAALVGGG